MPHASMVSNPPAAPAAEANDVSSNAGHSNPTCGEWVHQPFHPLTRSMTRAPSPGLNEGGSASTSTCRSISDASFSIQLAALRPTVTHARTPHKVTSSGWKPLTQPVVLSEGRKCAGLTTAKRSRVASSRAVKDSTNHSASRANKNVPSGNKYRDEENKSHGELDGAVMPSPPKKLQTCKDPSDSPSIRKSTIRILGAKRGAFLSRGKSGVETGKNVASVPAQVVSASTNVIHQPVNTLVPFLSQQQQLGTAKISTAATQAMANETSQANQLAAAAVTSVPLLSQHQQLGAAKISNAVTQSIANETSKVNQLAAAVRTLPKRNPQTDYEKKPASQTIVPNKVSRLGGATAPLVAPKLEIGKGQNTSNLLSDPAYARALLIKQQEKLLQHYKAGPPQQPHHHIKGPVSALLETEEPPPVEPLGTRCQLCKLDVAFRPRGDAGRDGNAPPVVAVLACHHAFHSSCIESIYGLAEPAECLACLEPGAVHTDD